MVDSLLVDEVLTTTRSVRKRLDFTRPVERQVLEECLAAAQQAPSGGNLQTWGFVVITERDRRAALADLYRQGYHTFLSTPIAEAMGYGNPNVEPGQRRVTASIDYLVANLEKAPVFVIPALRHGRRDCQPHCSTPCMARSCRRPGASCSQRGLVVWARVGLSFTSTTKRKRRTCWVSRTPRSCRSPCSQSPIPRAAPFGQALGSRLQTLIHWETW